MRFSANPFSVLVMYLKYFIAIFIFTEKLNTIENHVTDKGNNDEQKHELELELDHELEH